MAREKRVEAVERSGNVLVKAKRFHGFKRLGYVKLPADVAEAVGKTHLSNDDASVEIDRGLAAGLNKEHFEITEA